MKLSHVLIGVAVAAVAAGVILAVASSPMSKIDRIIATRDCEGGAALTLEDQVGMTVDQQNQLFMLGIACSERDRQP